MNERTNIGRVEMPRVRAYALILYVVHEHDPEPVPWDVVDELRERRGMSVIHDALEDLEMVEVEWGEEISRRRASE